MSETVGSQRCSYRVLDNGIHEFVFYEASKQAIDDFFQILEGLLKATPHDQTLRYVVDVTGGDREVSLVSMAQRFRKLENQLPHRARGRTAVLHKPGVLVSFIDNFIRALAPSRDVTRFFPVDRRTEAIAWLLSE